MAEHLNTLVLSIVVQIVEYCGVLVILLEVLRAAWGYGLGFVGARPLAVPSLRLRLGQSLVMGLEFLVAADILRTALNPHWNDMLLLAALIGLRTALNYVLQRELRDLDGGESRGG